MSMYRTSMMLYSSVFALSLVVASDGFCVSKESTRTEKTSELKEKSVAVDSKKLSDTNTKPKKDIVTPLTDAEEAADDKLKMEQIKKEQKKLQFAKKIETIRMKYAALFSAISGESKENIAKKLGEHSEKVSSALLAALSDPKSDVYEKLEKGIKRKNTFIQSKKESIGTEDAEWFGELCVAAEKQLKRLAKLNAEFDNNKMETKKEETKKQEEIRIIYADKINNFLASYDAFTACTHYLAKAKEYCNDSAISFEVMKVRFEDFSSKAFKEAAVPSDILSGKRDPFASIKGYKFYAIGKDEYQNGKYLSQIPPESDEAKYIATAKSRPMSQILLAPQNGGLILSSQMIQKEGMDRPICVFYSYAADGGKETVYRFSLVHESEETTGRQLTAQLIHAENQPEQSKLVEAAAELKLAFKKAKETKTSDKSTKKADDKSKKKTVAKDDKKEEAKVAKEDDKPKTKDKTDDKPKEKAVAKDDDKVEAKVAKDTEKPAKKATDESDKTKEKVAKDADKSSKKSADKDEKKKEKAAKDADKPAKKAANESDKSETKASEKKSNKEDKKHKAEEKKEETPKKEEAPNEEKKSFFGNLFGSKDKEKASAGS